MVTPLIESYVTANGVRFHYASQGEGPLVLLLHGFPERWFSWRHQLPMLAALGYRAVAPDLRGYGETERPRGGYEIENLARDVAELIPALGAERATLIGHDWGGALAWETVSRFPGRVERLAVLNCPHPAVLARTILTSRRQLRKSWYIFFFQLPRVPEWALTRNDAAAVARILKGMAVDRDRFDDATIRPYRDAILAPGAATAMLAYYRRIVRATLLPARRRAWLASYPVVEHPTLVLWAEDDLVLGNELVPPHVDVCRDLRVRRVPRCGHFLQQEQPERVNDILAEWLGPAEDAG